MHLPVDDHRIDELSAVFDDDVVENLNEAGAGIDRHERGMAGITERPHVARGAITRGDLQAAFREVGREVLWLQVPGPRDLGQRHARAAPDDAAFRDPHVGGIGLQQPRADPACPLGQHARGLRDRPARHHHRAGGPCSRREGNVERIALQHLDAIKLDAENLVRHLGQCRLMALTVRMRADADLDVPVRGQPCACLFVSRHHRTAPIGQHRSSHRALLAKDRKTDAEEPSVAFPAALPVANCC